MSTLDTVPKNWYVKLELRRGTEDWGDMMKEFICTFNFEAETPTVDNALQVVMRRIWSDPVAENEVEEEEAMKQDLACYKLAIEGNDAESDDEELRHLEIIEAEGEIGVQGLELQSPDVTQPVKVMKVNIGSEEKPRFANVRDYWDEETVSKITGLLREYQEVFPTKFSEMKGIIGDLGVMRIPLKEDVKPCKQRPYRMNLRYKEKVQAEINRMLETRISEPFEESEWISPMVIQEKKTAGEIRIYVDRRKLNDACLHDPFPTLTNEFLENVGGQEVYSFTYGFLGYHHI